MEIKYEKPFGRNWSFIAMEYYLGILNRTYQIFVSPNLIAGAFVNSALPAPARLPKYWFDPKTYVNQKLSGKYNELTSYSEEFKKISPRSNFQYQRSDIDNFSYDPTIKWGMGNVPHSGKLYMNLKSGKKREFILLGLQQGKEFLLELGKNPTFGADLENDTELHNALAKAYEKPQDIKVWIKLIELFSARGEKAQEHYCKIQANYLV